MSNTALTLVWETSKQDGSRLLILLAVADSINRETGSTFLSLDYLAQKARVSRRTLLDQLGPLEESNELGIAHGAGPRGCNVYSLGSFYKWGANFAPPAEAAEGTERVPPASGGRAESARVQSDYAISHPYRMEPVLDSSILEEEVVGGMGANPAPHSAPPHDQTPWVQVLAIVKSGMPRDEFDTWVAQTELLSLAGGILTIATGNSIALAKLENGHRAGIEAAVASVFGRPLRVRFVVAVPG